jgi:hypothetical protein
MLLTLDADEVRLVLMMAERIEAETTRQLDKGFADGCSGAAWYCTKYSRERVTELRERLKHWQKDEAEESANG